MPGPHRIGLDQSPRAPARAGRASEPLRTRNATRTVLPPRHLGEGGFPFELLLRHSYDGVNVCEYFPKTYTRRLVACNARYVAMSGYSRHALFRAPDLNQLAMGLDRPCQQKLNHRAFMRGRCTRGVSTWIRPDGKPNLYEWTACPFTRGGRWFIVGIDRDITDRQRIEIERHHLAARLIETQEAERQAIGATLHDHLGQLLTLARMELKAIQPLDPRSRQHRDNAGERLDKAIAAVRSLAHTLRPPLLDELGLPVAIEALVEDLAQVHDADIRYARRGPDPVLNSDEQLCLYRALQEALTNAVRHSGATRIAVSLSTTSRQVTLRVRDNGKGFDPNLHPVPRGIGLPGMRERVTHTGGTLDIQSRPGRGARVTVCLPAASPPARA